MNRKEDRLKKLFVITKLPKEKVLKLKAQASKDFASA
jgi:hypothetical protein